MTPEAIVRALADCAPVRMTEHGDRLACGLCDDEVREGATTTGHDMHEPDCPWRLAVEWVAAQDALAAAIDATDEAAWLVDESGWQSFTDDGRTRIEIVLTRRGKTAMSAQQMDNLRRGLEMTARAFEPDEPIPYVGEAAANLKHGTGGGER